VQASAHLQAFVPPTSTTIVGGGTENAGVRLFQRFRWAGPVSKVDARGRAGNKLDPDPRCLWVFFVQDYGILRGGRQIE